MEYFATTDIGLVRNANQDSYYADESGLFIIADGMGGHAGGECASRMAVDGIRAYIKKNAHLVKENPAALLAGAVKSANSEIYNKTLGNKSLSGMGTTAEVCLIAGAELHIAHVGDSRAYLFSGGALGRITTDHSFVEQLVESGAITPGEAQNHPDKNIITRAVGTEAKITADLYCRKTKKDDMLLMCSDGLSNMVSDKEIEEVLKSGKTTKEIGQRLVEMAKKNGGADNITVIVVKF